MSGRRRARKRPVDQEKQAAKRLRRRQRKEAEARARRAAARRRRIRNALTVSATVVVLGLLGFVVVRRAVPPELPGVERPPGEGRTHVAAGQSAVYATPTPTSGPHSPSSARCGVFSQQVPPELAVHSLEHGTVVIWYRASLDDDTVAELRSIVERFDDRVILSPNAQLTRAVVATAWERLKAYDGPNPELAAFIETYRGRAPENLRCAY